MRCGYGQSSCDLTVNPVPGNYLVLSTAKVRVLLRKSEVGLFESEKLQHPIP
jgi:hypothetical protein